MSLDELGFVIEVAIVGLLVAYSVFLVAVWLA